MKTMVALLAAAAFAAGSNPLPRQDLTPGVVNPQVNQTNIATTICVSNWTSTIRPPASYTNKLKAQQMREYGYPADADPHAYEEDHLISLEVGGHPRDPKNLWPQPWEGACGAHAKDQLENRLHKMVCAGELKLTEAQEMLAHDWVNAHRKLIGEGC